MGGQPYFVLWQEGEKEPDRYILESGSQRLLWARTIETLLEHAAKRRLEVVDQEVHCVDMDAVFKVLTHLRSDRTASQRSCEHLLSGWNSVEDLAKSLDIPLKDFESDEKEILHTAYDRTFWGNNLPAVTPAGQSYHPLFPKEERKAMGRYLRSLWREILARGALG